MDLCCSKCSLQFGNKSVYGMHLSIVHKEIIVDLKEGPNHSTLEKETKEPEKEQFQCENGSKALANKRNLKRPEAKKAFKCYICDYSCSLKASLKRHVDSVHGNKKPFKCEMCDYSCSQKPTMKRHVESVHEKKKPFKCDICAYSYPLRANLKRHVDSVHGNIETI